MATTSKCQSIECSGPNKVAELDWSASVSVVVHENDTSHSFPIHRHVVMQWPFFEAYAERWDRGEGVALVLPCGVELDVFKRLIQRTYTGRLNEPPESLQQALDMFCLVDMLLVEWYVPEIMADICSLCHTVEHIASLRAYAERLNKKLLSELADELEAELEDPVLKALMVSVLTTEKSIDQKLRILKSTLERREKMGLATRDAATLLQSMAANAWSYQRDYSTLQPRNQIWGLHPKLPALWNMISHVIDSKDSWKVVLDLARALDVGTAWQAKNGKQVTCCENRSGAIDILQGSIRIGIALARKDVVTFDDVIQVLPSNMSNQELEQVFSTVMESFEHYSKSILPLTKKVSAQFLECQVRKQPLLAARQLARYIIAKECELQTSDAVFNVIFERQLI